MQDPNDLQQQILQQHDVLQQQREALQQLQEAKLKALQDTIGNYGNYKYVDLDDFLDPDNKNWADYKYKTFSPLVGLNGHVGRGTPVGEFINNIRNAETIDDVKKQLELWNSYKPLDLPHNGKSYVNHIVYGLSDAPYGGSRPVFPTTDGSDSVQTTAGGTQGGVAVGGKQGVQTGNTGGGTPSTQGVQTRGTGIGTGGTGSSSGGSTYASAGVPKGGTKTIGYGYDPNPGNISLAYVMRNAPEQERRDALINKWNRENGRESVPYVPGTEIPAGSLNRSSSTYASPNVSTGGTYATGEGIKDANGNVLTNPGGDWEYQYALKNPQYGLGMMSKMSDAQKNYLQAVSDNMGYKYNFTGANRFV